MGAATCPDRGFRTGGQQRDEGKNNGAAKGFMRNPSRWPEPESSAIDPANFRAAGACIRLSIIESNGLDPTLDAECRLEPRSYPAGPQVTNATPDRLPARLCRSRPIARCSHAFTRRALRDNDVRIDIRYCGVCHSTCTRHATTGATRSILYPRSRDRRQVAAAGPSAKRFKVGDWSRSAAWWKLQGMRRMQGGREVFCQKAPR